MFDVTPLVSPMPTDCGATCLKMLISYYNPEDDTDLDTLIKECHTSINGCTGRDLMEAGRKHGLDMMAWGEEKARKLINVPEDENRKKLDFGIFDYDRPAIVWWKFNHFCVYCGLNDHGKVVICNPDRGRYSISKSLFNAFYSGVDFTNGEPQKLGE